MPRKPPESMTMAELLTLPVTLELPEVCRALRISRSYAYKLIAEGRFPIPAKRYNGAALHFARADLFRELGLDPAMVAAPGASESRAA
jgi:predicted DNA-binding transcriptional regulator AlpA